MFHFVFLLGGLLEASWKGLVHSFMDVVCHVG
jgi:hypothetical protein